MLADLSAFSAPVDSSYATIIASKFFTAKKHLHSGQLTEVTTIYNELYKGIPLIYYINFAEGGFVIISADDAAFPIIGFDLSGQINPNDYGSSPAFKEWMTARSNELKNLRDNQLDGLEFKNAEWNIIHNFDAESLSDYLNCSQSISPLLTTTWNQGCYYNDLCPSGSSCPCSKHWTGCVATAMAQIMKFHNFPQQGIGSHGYTDPGTGNYLFANFGNTTYNWAAMPNNVTSTNFDVATLMFHCGVSVDMSYLDCSYGSGAGTYYLPDRLIQYFNYLNTAACIHKYNFNDADYQSALRNEIDSKRPILYGGFADDAVNLGHEFICDGIVAMIIFILIGDGEVVVMDFII